MKNKYFNNITGKAIILLLIVLIFYSCDKNKSKIPLVVVDIWIDLTDPLYYDLQQISNYVYITGGVNGIIVYRNTADEFFAYERTCPHDPECGKVFVDENSFSIAIDTICCGSEFLLMLDGAVSSGPSKFPLKKYYCEYSINNQSLHIKN